MLYEALIICILITMPNPGTISLPLGSDVSFDESFFSAELDADEVVVKLVDTAPVADVIVVPCTSFDIVGTVAVRSCTVTVSTDIAGAIC